MATGDNTGFPTFSKFLEAVTATEHAGIAARPGTRVGEAAEFDAMKQHILGLYEGVDVQHSFIDDSGQVFDCMPIEQQPSLKGHSGPVPDAPDVPAASGAGHDPVDVLKIEPQLRAGRVDRFGHAMTCPPGTIPMRRVTLDELTRYEKLDDFFQKTPFGAGQHPRLGTAGITAGVHKWAHAYEVVNNLGGHSDLNLWDPAVGSQVFSLSQHWYAGGSPVQTVELGWQVYPAKYGTTLPCLFIYWTADGYNKTGNYNLDRPAFVQTNRNWTLGGTLGPLSVPGGTQYELSYAAYLSGGHWWIYLGGTAGSNAIGYYPASQYGSGPLATNALDIDYGGEVVDVTAWPPMGSGAFAAAWWQHAAYQRDVDCYPTTGGARPASLTPAQASANCFTVSVGSAAAPWNEYFFFGGPGGTGCT
jgi:hypothetical protein